MKKEFIKCDRCEVVLNRESKDYIFEIQLMLASEKIGKTSMETADLCADCRNSLIKWFGKFNPFTGREFVKMGRGVSL